MKWLKYLVLGGIFVVLALVFYLGPSAKEKLVTSIVSSGLSSNAYNDDFGSALKLSVAGSQFENKWQINKAPRKGFLNVYVLAKGIDQYSGNLKSSIKPFLNNCSYIGENIIVCDSAYVEGFLTSHHVQDFFAESVRAGKMRENQKAFLLWILGHEVGHVASGHSPAHFEPDPMNRMVATSSLDNQREFEADSYFVGRLLANEQTRIAVETMLIDLLNAEIKEKIGQPPTYGVGIIYDYSDQKVVTYAREGTHPEFVVRLTRMLQLSTKAANDTGLNNLIERFANHMREASKN
jgi:hypothetical protein